MRKYFFTWTCLAVFDDRALDYLPMRMLQEKVPQYFTRRRYVMRAANDETMETS